MFFCREKNMPIVNLRLMGYRRVRITMCSECIDWIELRIRLNEFEMFI